MKTRSMKVRLLSLLMCLTLVVGVLPITGLRNPFPVNAAEDPTVVIAGSDYQASNDTTGTTKIQSILSQMGYKNVDGVLFAGDYSYGTTDETNISNLKKAFTDKLTIANDPVLVQGNHDADSFVSNGSLSASGEHDADEYGVFVIHEQDYMYKNDDENRIKKTADNLEKYLDAKIDADYTKPIFVVSHLPLHYSMRTQVESHDGKHAKYIFDVLNQAGEDGLNIIFLFGHNHSHGWDDPYGGASIFLTKGDNINIAQHSTTEYTQETLNFTYMNAGYVGYYRHVNQNAETTLTMTSFEITDDNVTIKRYSENGIYQLKSAGVPNKHAVDGSSVDGSCSTNHKGNETYDPDTSTVASPYTLELDKSLTSVDQTDVSSGITVSAPGITGVTVEKQDKSYDTDKYSAYCSYDIKVEGYTDGTSASVTIPVPENFDPAKQVQVLYGGTVIAKVPIVNGKITFKTNHFSVYDIAQLATDEVTTWLEIPGETKTIFRLTNSLKSGNKYVIVSTNQAGEAKAVNLNASSGNYYTSYSIGEREVRVIEDTNGNYIEAPANTVQWTYTDFKFQNVSYTGQYLRGNSDNLNSNSWKDLSYTTWNYNASYGLRAESRTLQNIDYRYMTSVTTTDSSYSSTNRVYIYEEGTLTIPATYAGMAGQTEYNIVTAAYSSQTEVENMIKKHITVYTAENATGTDAAATDNYQITGTVNPGVTGTYTLTVTYSGKTLGTIKVHVVDKIATSISVDPMEGSVERGSRGDTPTGSTMTVTYDDGTTEQIPVTVKMLSGNMDISKNGTYPNLTVSYLGQTVTGYTLKVVNVSGNDYPTYPSGGSVKVDKIAKGEDFQNTGVARVNLSVSGLPSEKGSDVVIVIDTSSSMNNNVGNNGKTRIQVLSESLEKMLNNFKQKDASGKVPDMDIAIIDFNGYGSGIDGATLNNSGRNAQDLAKIFTGKNAGKTISEVGLSAADFVDNASLDAAAIAGQFTKCESGTNYDGALKNAYTLLSAKKEANTEDREQFVIFLSDGAPFRYNGYDHGTTEYNLWSEWLEGKWENVDALKAAKLEYTNFPGSYPEFYNGQVAVTNGTAQPHRMAEAIKGDVNKTYDVVINTAQETGYFEQYEGLGAKIYSIGFGLAPDTAGDTSVTVDTQKKVLEALSSGAEYYYPDVQSATELDAAFNQIVGNIRFAAQNAVFKDQMGTSFDLQMNPTIKDSQGNTRNNISTDIKVTSYDIYTEHQLGTIVNDHTVTAEDIGKTYGTGTNLETVSFKMDGTNLTASSDKKTGNILIDGVICANTFWYNTTNAEKTITVNGSKVQLEPETFYWNVGTINEKQFTLSYAVYLTGSMEGNVAEGSYDTNKFATLSYTNWLGNDVSQSVASPTLPWGGANVSYAFYLVNKDGKPVDSSGKEVANIITAYKVTQPVLYKNIRLNSSETLSDIETIAKNVLPTGYTLYDGNAAYTVSVASGSGAGSWTIAGDHKETTYVTGYAGPQDYSNASTTQDETYDYTHTTVYFAVCWEVGTVPDTVVIDYGLPVDISVLANDMFGTLGTLAAVGPYTSKMENEHTQSLTEDFESQYANATTVQNKVRYTPTNMEMKEPDVFAYAVSYTGEENPGYYYGKVTVISATTVYYEDSFVTLSSYTNNTKDESTKWTQEGTTVEATQGEDRPGKYSRPEYDANNIYGYDSAYTNMSQYSMGSAAKIHVDADTYGTAEFDFYGTGFDVISMTSNTTGVLGVQVKAAEQIGDIAAGTVVKSTVVNTYYGYTRELHEVTYTYQNGTWIQKVGDLATGQVESKAELPNEPAEGTEVSAVEYVWIATPNAENALYQVPVIKVNDLAYGKYTVKITATYLSVLDQTTADGYDLYLDAIRIYDPTGNQNQTANDAYVADGEGWPVYEELRNNIIAADTFDISNSKAVNGIVFIDGNAKNADITDYKNYGSNNELYLAQGQAIAFNVNAGANVADIQLGMKVARGNSVTYTINGVEKTVSTTTDLYYSIKDAASGTVVIQNTSGGILSLTNIKVTHTQAPSETATSLLWMDGPSATAALMRLRPEPEVPVFAPEKLEVTLSKTKVTVGDKVKVTVKTSEDVEYLTVNGDLVTDYRTNRRTGERTWNVNLTAETVGEMNVEVIAYNSEHVDSEAVEHIVTVVEKKTITEIMKDIWDGFFGWIFG